MLHIDAVRECGRVPVTPGVDAAIAAAIDEDGDLWLTSEEFWLFETELWFLFPPKEHGEASQLGGVQ